MGNRNIQAFDTWLGATYEPELVLLTGVQSNAPDAQSNREQMIDAMLEKLGLMENGHPTPEAQKIIDKYAHKEVTV